MKRVIDAVMSLFIFTITFLTKEILERTDIFAVKANIWQEYLLFLVLYIIVYLIVKSLQFIVKRKKNKRVRDMKKVASK